MKPPHDPHHTGGGLHSYFTHAASSQNLPNPKSKKHTALHTRNQSKECLEEGSGGGGQHVLKLRLSNNNNSLIVEQRPANQANYGYPYLTEGGDFINERLTQANENPYYDSQKEDGGGLRSNRKGLHTKGQRSM